MRFRTEDMEPYLDQVVRQEDSLGARGLTEREVYQYILSGGTGLALVHHLSGSLLGHMLLLQSPGHALIDRLIIYPEWQRDWTVFIVSITRDNAVNPMGTGHWDTVIRCPVDDVLLATALSKERFRVVREEPYRWGGLCYRFELPLDDLPSFEIAYRAKAN